MSDRDQAASLWRQADDLRVKGERLKVEGEALCRAAERLNAFAAAIADGRADDCRGDRDGDEPMSMTPERLREIAEAATPGPWSVRDDDEEGVRLSSTSIETLADFGRDPGATSDAVLAALVPDLARVAAGLAEAARWYIECLEKVQARNVVRGLGEAEVGWQIAFAAFEQLGEQDDTQAAIEVRVSGEESKATTGTVT